MFKCIKWVKWCRWIPYSFNFQDKWLMNSTWGQQRHFHKSFYGCHHLGRTWAKAVFSFQSPRPHGLHPDSPPGHSDRFDCLDQISGLRGVLQSLLAQTRRGSHHNHFLPSLTWNLKSRKSDKINPYTLFILSVFYILLLTFAFIAHPLLCKCKLNASQFVCLEKSVPSDQ